MIRPNLDDVAKLEPARHAGPFDDDGSGHFPM
jgi:hypothetical protein